MIIIRDKLINVDIFSDEFHCNLEACKGACCWEGDFGAPLDTDELDILEKEYLNIRPFISAKGQAKMDKTGTHAYYPEDKIIGTPLLENAACAFMIYNESGIAGCGIEKAYLAGKTKFRKPISCHLYPIRVEKDHSTGFEVLKYDRWEICSAACVKGIENNIKVFQFCSEALIRKYGEEWYDELVAAYENLYRSNQKMTDKALE
ncbi:MAG: DUF3109 family protein [Bacteroidia bacterium]|nr:DUF3109 family protein [Bacteroidia bacterium]